MLCRLFVVKVGVLLYQPVRPRPPDGEGALLRVAQPSSRIGIKPSDYQRRVASGSALYEWQVANDIVTYGWVAGSHAVTKVLHDLTLRVPPEMFYIWDCETLPEHRGRRYFQAFLEALVSGAVPEKKFGLVAVDVHNAASRKALTRAGFRPLFTYCSVRVAGRTVLSLSWARYFIGGAQRQFDKLHASQLNH